MANRTETRQLTAAIQELSAAMQKQQQELDTSIAAQSKYSDALEEATFKAQDNTKAEVDLFEARKKLREEIEKGTEASQDEIKTLKERITTLTKATQTSNSFASSIERATSTLIQATLGIRQASDGTTKFIKTLAEAGSVTEGLKKATGNLTKEQTKQRAATFGANLALGAAVSITQKFAEATFSAFKTSQQLQLTLGRELGIATTAGELDNILTAAQNSTNAAVSFETLGNAVGQLQRSTRGLLGNIAENNLELALFTDEMRTVGVETQTSAELFGNFALILGKEGVGQAKNLETSLVKLARTNGLASDQMVKDIAAITDQLAQFGDRADDIGLEIAKISTFTKIGAKNIADFAQGFEYFPDAIERANQLNLAFQANLVSGQQLFEMMNDGRGPAEVMKTVLGALGTQIDETFLKSPFKVRALAESLGISRAEAMNLGKEMIAARNSGKSLNQIIDEQAQKAEGNAKALEAVTNFQDKINKLQEKFAIALSPVVDLLSDFLDIVNKIPAPLIKTFGIVAAGSFTAVAASLFRVAAGVAAVFGPLGLGIGALLGAGVGLASMDDGVIIAQGGKMNATKINSQDQVSLMAGKPGGPLSRAGGTDAVEIVVNLFGQELVRKMVDLVEGEQGKRKQIFDAVAGGA